MSFRTRRIVSAGGFVAIVLAGGCAKAPARWAGASEIRSVLAEQQVAWNDGKIEDFMGSYWRSANLSFSSGGRVTRGWNETLAGYRKRYPTRDAMGHLTFSDLETMRLADDVALVLGRWHLERDEPVGGAFSLVLRRDEGRWVIVHDHTSRDQP